MAGDDLTLAPSRSHADVSSGRGSAVATDRRRTVSIGVAVPVGGRPPGSLRTWSRPHDKD
jgi:hypothetical protein